MTCAADLRNPNLQSVQPYNHLPIEGFFVDSNQFPADQPTYSRPSSRQTPSPDSSPSRPPSPYRQHQVPTPLSIRPSAPQASDTALLSTIFFLSRLAHEPNAAKFIKDGGVERLRERFGGDEGCAEEGARECESAGVRVAKEWFGGWGIDRMEL